MADKTNNSWTPDVPLGFAAIMLGTLALLVYFAGRVGLMGQAPEFLFPIGVALFLSGYIACFTVRRHANRIAALEHRMDALTKENAKETNREKNREKGTS